jgi:hypothetical protein
MANQIVKQSPKLKAFLTIRNPRLAGKAKKAHVVQAYEDIFEIVHSPFYTEKRVRTGSRGTLVTVDINATEEQVNALVANLSVVRVVGLIPENVMEPNSLAWYNRMKASTSTTKNAEGLTPSEAADAFMANWLNRSTVQNPETNVPSLYHGHQKYQSFRLGAEAGTPDMDLCASDFEELALSDVDVVPEDAMQSLPTS